jgi:hypothetical protein
LRPRTCAAWKLDHVVDLPGSPRWLARRWLADPVVLVKIVCLLMRWFFSKTSQMGLTCEEILRVWREAEQIPVFEHAWLWDHMVPLRGDIRGAALEAWTLLAALAAQTSRLRLGVMAGLAWGKPGDRG